MFPLITENLVVKFEGKHILGPIDLKIDKGDIAVILAVSYTHLPLPPNREV